ISNLEEDTAWVHVVVGRAGLVIMGGSGRNVIEGVAFGESVTRSVIRRLDSLRSSSCSLWLGVLPAAGSPSGGRSDLAVVEERGARVGLSGLDVGDRGLVRGLDGGLRIDRTLRGRGMREDHGDVIGRLRLVLGRPGRSLVLEAAGDVPRQLLQTLVVGVAALDGVHVDDVVLGKLLGAERQPRSVHLLISEPLADIGSESAAHLRVGDEVVILLLLLHGEGGRLRLLRRLNGWDVPEVSWSHVGSIHGSPDLRHRPHRLRLLHHRRELRLLLHEVGLLRAHARCHHHLVLEPGSGQVVDVGFPAGERGSGRVHAHRTLRLLLQLHHGRSSYQHVVQCPATGSTEQLGHDPRGGGAARLAVKVVSDAHVRLAVLLILAGRLLPGSWKEGRVAVGAAARDTVPGSNGLRQEPARMLPAGSEEVGGGHSLLFVDVLTHAADAEVAGERVRSGDLAEAVLECLAVGAEVLDVVVAVVVLVVELLRRGATDLDQANVHLSVHSGGRRALPQLVEDRSEEGEADVDRRILLLAAGGRGLGGGLLGAVPVPQPIREGESLIHNGRSLVLRVIAVLQQRQRSRSLQPGRLQGLLLRLLLHLSPHQVVAEHALLQLGPAHTEKGFVALAVVGDLGDGDSDDEGEDQQTEAREEALKRSSVLDGSRRGYEDRRGRHRHGASLLDIDLLGGIQLDALLVAHPDREHLHRRLVDLGGKVRHAFFFCR
ncbi:hypothetical protein PENTCL1PPCAC_8846, partial [Pristionchus entomophagus]